MHDDGLELGRVLLLDHVALADGEDDPVAAESLAEGIVDAEEHLRHEQRARQPQDQQTEFGGARPALPGHQRGL
jgi:hypothetical protein